MEQTGYVEKVIDGYALVRVMRVGACESAHGDCAHCDGCAEAREHRIMLENTCGASEGDRVLLTVEGTRLARYLLLLFLPLPLWIVAYVALEALAVPLAPLLSAIPALAVLFAVTAIARKKGWGRGTVRIRGVL